MEQLRMVEEKLRILNYFANYIESQLGIVYLEANYYQLEHRLKDLSVVLGLSGIEELFEKSQAGITGDMKKFLLDSATNNETSFFRDPALFRALSSYILPQIMSDEQQNINIWSAASSSGQEPYSIAMIIAEYRKSHNLHPVNLLASDVSEKMLKRVQDGTFSDLEVGRGLLPSLRDEFFNRIGPDKWEVRPSLREGLTTKKINLLEEWGHFSSFNLIFVRNVLIYQNLENKKKVIDQIFSRLKPKGFLILGAAESLFGVSDKYKQIAHEGAIFFQKP